MSSPTPAEWKASEKCDSFILTYRKNQKMKKGTLQLDLHSSYRQLASFMASCSVDHQRGLLLLDNA
jgi:hypothetical protein